MYLQQPAAFSQREEHESLFTYSLSQLTEVYSMQNIIMPSYSSTATWWWVQASVEKLGFWAGFYLMSSHFSGNHIFFYLCLLHLQIKGVGGGTFPLCSHSAFPSVVLEGFGDATLARLKSPHLWCATPALNLCKSPSQNYIYKSQGCKSGMTHVNVSTG